MCFYISWPIKSCESCTGTVILSMFTHTWIPALMRLKTELMENFPCDVSIVNICYCPQAFCKYIHLSVRLVVCCNRTAPSGTDSLIFTYSRLSFSTLPVSIWLPFLPLTLLLSQSIIGFDWYRFLKYTRFRLKLAPPPFSIIKQYLAHVFTGWHLWLLKKIWFLHHTNGQYQPDNISLNPVNSLFLP